MEHRQGKYALIQFCPLPERQEYLNIGLVLLVPSVGYAAVRIARNQRRVDRVFGKQSKAYLDAIKVAFESRLNLELSMSPSGESLGEFSRKRANEIRLSSLLPIQVGDPNQAMDRLFAELVSDDDAGHSEPRIRRRLREAFAANKVEQFLDPAPSVDLPEYGLTVKTPYGYQNGCYNLVDAMRVPPAPAEALREVGKRVFEGGLIWKHGNLSSDKKRLVVVGDFSQQSNEFYHAVSGQFGEAHVKLYRFDDLNPLFRDIAENAEAHGKVHH